MKAVTMALFAVVVLAACSSGHPVATATPTPTKPSSATAAAPAEGVQFTGAVSGTYPISNGGTCPFLDTITGRELLISANPGAGQPYMGAVVENFNGPGEYSDVQWPPEGHSSLYVADGDRIWHAESGVISVVSFGGGGASGTLSASNLREVNGSTTVSAAGSWTCRLLFPATAQPSPSPKPIVYPSQPPPPVGTPVARQVLPPATVMPAVDLCSADLVITANGNVYPLLCQSGAVNVTAWRFYVQVSSNILALGHDVTLEQVQAALCADQSQNHATYVEEGSAYELAAPYYGWGFTPEPNCR